MKASPQIFYRAFSPKIRGSQTTGCTIQPKFLTPDWKTAYNLGGLSKGFTISPCWDFGFLGWEGGFLRGAEQATRSSPRSEDLRRALIFGLREFV